MIVSIQHITKCFAGTKALDDVSFDIPEGSIYGLLGPNGAGKTTCIRILNQMIRPDAGEITIDGKPLRESDVERIGYLPEERGLYKKMRVAEQILYFASLKNMEKNRAKQELEFWIDRLGIENWCDKRIEELSKGMQQKVQFIATVLHKPSLLILDEPFSGFDPVNAQAIKDEVIRLKNEGTTILLSTHNMNSVEELCDNISLIHRSKQILNGSVSNIRNSFAGNTYEVVFSGYCDTLSTTLTPSLKILGKQVDGNLTKLQIELMPQVSTNDAIQFLMKSGAIVSFQQILPSMNDIFIQAVKQHNESEHGENV
ncbi:MAG: ATP-binding cassette domain-containing protein [Bacteroidales bacterium]|nr:ATP-binding cassette domain-containing protein [Bacteroidales bacterium]